MLNEPDCNVHTSGVAALMLVPETKLPAPTELRWQITQSINATSATALARRLAGPVLKVATATATAAAETADDVSEEPPAAQSGSGPTADASSIDPKTEAHPAPAAEHEL